MSHNRLIVLIGIAALIILLVYIASIIKTDINFAAPCYLYAQREWMLMRSGPDTFETQLIDRRHEDQRKIDLFQAERGDLVRFSLAEGIKADARIESGQEIAHLHSLENQQESEQLRLRLAEAEAELRQAQTGAKEELIHQGESAIAAAEARLAGALAIFNRTRSLHSEGLASQADFDRDQAEYLEAEAELELYKNSLEALVSGEKSAVIDALQARVDLLNQRIESARISIEAGSIHCQIGGEVVTLQGDSALVRIADLDTLYAIAPITPTRAERIVVGSKAYISTPAMNGADGIGHIVRIDRIAATNAGRTYFWTTVAIPNNDRYLAAGSLGQIRFRGQKVSALTWLRDQFANASDQQITTQW